MAIIASSKIGANPSTVTQTTLTASDTFTYVPNGRQVLILNNGTAGALTVNIDGDGASTVNVGGVGSIDISGGYSTGAIAAGAIRAIQIDGIKEYLVGTIAVTGGSGITATLLTY